MRHCERGFIEFPRRDPGYRPVEERRRDYREVEKTFSESQLRQQAARCMDCGIPFCQSAGSVVGCPVFNRIPEFNDQLYHGQWEEALALLLQGSCFPEFTGRVCPAPCETSCVCGINREPVAIRQIERHIIDTAFERGYMRPRIPSRRTGLRIAVVGSGPAGLAAADCLNQAGFQVVVYERDRYPGGMLRYGIPDFKLEKPVVERRIDLMKQEGVVFETSVDVGRDISFNYIHDRFAALLLAGGARRPRDLNVEGRDLDGILYAMDFLARQNRLNSGEDTRGLPVLRAEGKHVVVVGGGDTGSDCVGTAIRQGASSVTQFEILPRPTDSRPPSTPWPEWPNRMRTSSSHQEGCERRWSVSTLSFSGEKGVVGKLNAIEVKWTFSEGASRPVPEALEGTEFSVPADLVLLAMGFTGPGSETLTEDIGVGLNAQGFVGRYLGNATSVKGVFVAGDMSDGPSLVVRAMQDGKNAARDIAKYLGVDF